MTIVAALSGFLFGLWMGWRACWGYYNSRGVMLPGECDLGDRS